MMLSLIKLHLIIKVEKAILVDFDVAETMGYEERILEDSGDEGRAGNRDETSSDEDLPPSWLLTKPVPQQA